jgi:thymidylate synthase
MLTTADIRNKFLDMHALGEFADDGNLEVVCAQFIADEPNFFGTVSEYYAWREHNWYMKQSRNIHDMEDVPPGLWQKAASADGIINSNYGWAVFSEENGYQFDNAVAHIKKNINTRHGLLIYTRPSMHTEAFENERYDFMCTNTVHMMVRSNRLWMNVNMRSSDAIFGYRYDLRWHKFIQNMAVSDLKNSYPKIKAGPIVWNATSFHIYPRNFPLLEQYHGR